MKIKNSIVIPKYKNNDYLMLSENNIYRKNGKTYITLYCILEKGEDTQYPLENLLDGYLVNCTEHIENLILNEKNVLIVELEGEYENIVDVSKLIGKEFK